MRATSYIIICSAKNRVRRQLRRLREPRYLVGALAGVAYFYFAVFGRMRLSQRSSRQRAVPTALLPMLGGVGPIAAGLSLLSGAVLSIAMPVGSGLFHFSQTESEFLVASPLSRRQLLWYRVMRSQGAVLFSAVVIALTYPLATPGARARGFVGAWLALMTCHMFFAGVSLTRARLALPSLRARLLIWVPRVLLVAAIAVILVGARHTIQAEGLPLDSAGDVFIALSRTCASGLPRLVLWPFMAVLAPLFAPSAATFMQTIPVALVVYGLTMAWVLLADEAFEAITDARMEGGQPRTKSEVSYRRRRPLWTLALRGRPETPFIWKTAVQTMRVVNKRLAIRLVLIACWIVSVLVVFSARSRGLTQVAGIFAALASAFAVVFGPQIVRFDLREDLQHLELLKTWPLRSAALIRGQIAGAAAVVTVIAWAFALLALILSTVAFTRADLAMTMATGAGFLIVSPALILAQFTIHNAAALLFPAWIGTGTSRPRGVDAMGQRLIVLGGTWVALLLAVLPAALLGVGLWWTFAGFAGFWVVPPSAAVASGVVLMEVLLATEALASVYERLDVTSVEPSES